MQPKPRKQPKRRRARRQGWGPAILVDFPEEADRRIEVERQRLGLDRTSFVRSVVMQRVSAGEAA